MNKYIEKKEKKNFAYDGVNLFLGHISALFVMHEIYFIQVTFIYSERNKNTISAEVYYALDMIDAKAFEIYYVVCLR